MKQKSQEQNYEALMTRLVSVVDRLEQGELPLADALTLYEEGVTLGLACEKHLQAVALRVEELSVGPEGTTLQPWNDTRS